VAARRESLNVTDDGAQRRARQGTNAGNLAQLLDAHIGASQSIELMFDGENLFLQQAYLLQHIG
jgi:hypothetical protein